MTKGVGVFRKIPHNVEAMKFSHSHLDEAKEFCPSLEIITFNGNVVVSRFSTIEGNVSIKPGDYIVKGTEGEFYPCKASIFNNTYERVEE